MIEPLGDRAVRLEIPAGIGRAALLDRLRAIAGAIDAVVTEAHAMVRFEGPPPAIDLAILDGLEGSAHRAREHVVEAIYDGPDLDEAAAIAGVSRDELIARHAGGTYVVSFVGFLPGFAYLRGLDRPLATIPRRASPRPRIDAGSIGIAGGFTGIYPVASPGGWRLIGRAPGFLAIDGDHARLAVGDRVRFARIG